MIENSYQVLHCHTTLSDGTMTHRGILDKCNDYNIGVVAFTDHDIMIPDKTFSELKKLKHKVKFISGIEFSATGTPEVEGGIALFHIIGLFVDHKNTALLEYCELAKKKRRERIALLVNKLNGVGFSITEVEVDRETSEGTLGRPHLARAVLAKDENFDVINRALLQLKKRGEDDPVLSAKYEEIRNNSRFQLMFDLFLGDKPVVQGIYSPYLRDVPLDFGVKLIREAGGIAILAHPSYYRDKVGVDLVEKFAKEHRIDGIETVYALPDHRNFDDFKDDMNKFKQLNLNYGLVSGGGGDFHTPEDFERLRIPANTLRMEETKDFLPRIFTKWPEYKEEVY